MLVCLIQLCKVFLDFFGWYSVGMALAYQYFHICDTLKSAYCFPGIWRCMKKVWNSGISAVWHGYDICIYIYLFIYTVYNAYIVIFLSYFFFYKIICILEYVWYIDMYLLGPAVPPLAFTSGFIFFNGLSTFIYDSGIVTPWCQDSW